MRKRRDPKPIERHQLATAWDEWATTPEGRSATETLPTARIYLENRLMRAFNAGAAAQEKIDRLKKIAVGMQ